MKSATRKNNQSNIINISSTPNTTKNTKFTESKRGVSNDFIREIPKYLNHNQTPQTSGISIKSLITQAEPGKQNSKIVFNTRNSPPINQVKSDRPSHSLSPTKALQNMKPYLPEMLTHNIGKKTLVLDLDETLVHSSFIPFDNPDITLNIELENSIHQIYVVVRPGAEEFLERMAKHYEVIIFTASLSNYADPLMDILDSKKSCFFRLFRQHCTFMNNVYIKDLTKIGRNLKDLIIVDNTPTAFAFQTENGIPIKSWYVDKSDRELLLLSPILEFLSKTNDVRDYIKRFTFNNEVSYQTAWNIIHQSKSSELDNQKNEDEKKNHLKTNSIDLKKQSYNTNTNIAFNKPSTTRGDSNKNDSNLININIINNNYNQYIFNENEEKVKKEDKKVKTFRTSYLSNNNEYENGNSLKKKQNNTGLQNSYNINNNFDTKPSIRMYNSGDKTNTVVSQILTTTRAKNHSNSNLLQKNPNQLNISTSPKVSSPSNQKPQLLRPASSTTIKTSSSKEKSGSINLKEMLNRKESNSSFIISNGSVNLNAMNRSESTSNFATKSKNLSKNLQITSKGTHSTSDLLELTGLNKGNNSTRPSSFTNVKFQKPKTADGYRHGENQKREYSLSNKSIDRKNSLIDVANNKKENRLSQEKYLQNNFISNYGIPGTNRSINKHPNSTRGIQTKSSQVLKEDVKNPSYNNIINSFGSNDNFKNQKNLGLFIHTESKNKMRSPSNGNYVNNNFKANENLVNTNMNNDQKMKKNENSKSKNFGNSKERIIQYIQS